MNDQPIFSARLLAVWIGAAAFLLVLSLYFMNQGGSGPGSDDVGPTVFSRSAIGHAAIADLLGRLGIPVTKSRYGAMPEGGDNALVLAEPGPTSDVIEILRGLLSAPRTLLVLPKRSGNPSRKRPGWLADTYVLPESSVDPVLDLLNADIKLVRTDRVDHWSENDLGIDPDIPSPVQLIQLQPNVIRPIVTSAQGILVGEISGGGRAVWILSDPDVIENHGFARGNNAAFAVALFNEFRMHRQGLTFDETEHGYAARPPGPLKLLFTFPYVFATLQGGIAILLLLSATVGRFGKPEPAPIPLAAGKRGLIRNSASLLVFAGSNPAIVQRYVQETVQDAARQLHAPEGLVAEALLAWLQRVGKARRGAVDCAAVIGRLNSLPAGARGRSAALQSIARDIYRWKREIIDGHPADSRNHRGHSRRGP
jgi:hypothetical protein